MIPFQTLTSVAAPLPDEQIDTDVIFPARFLLLPDKAGLGKQLFHERRAAGGFVLDRAPWDRAQILVTGPDFGTGSSREQAVWALADFGIRCVIGPSFGEIFQANCYRNGVLPVTLPGPEHYQVMAQAQSGEPMTVDLLAQRIGLSDGVDIGFAIDAHHKRALVEGLDEIAMVLRDDLPAIVTFEQAHRVRRPWLFLTAPQLAHFDEVAAERDA